MHRVTLPRKYIKIIKTSFIPRNDGDLELTVVGVEMEENFQTWLSYNIRAQYRVERTMQPHYIEFELDSDAVAFKMSKYATD